MFLLEMIFRLYIVRVAHGVSRVTSYPAFLTPSLVGAQDKDAHSQYSGINKD